MQTGEKLFDNYLKNQPFNHPLIQRTNKVHLAKCDHDQKDNSEGNDKTQITLKISKENQIKKRVMTFLDTSYENNNSAKKKLQNNYIDQLNQTENSPLLEKFRSTTYHNQPSQNQILLKQIVQPQKNTLVEKQYQRISAIQDQYYQFKPTIQLNKTSNSIIDNFINSPQINVGKQHSTKAFAISKRCETERERSFKNRCFNNHQDFENQYLGQKLEQNDQLEQQNFQSKKEYLQNKENQKDESFLHRVDSSKFLIKKQFINTNRDNKFQLPKKIISSQKLNDSNNDISKIHFVKNTANTARQNSKEISFISRNDLDQFIKPVNNMTPQLDKETQHTKNIISEDKRKFQFLQNIFDKKRSLTKQDSNNTSLNCVTEGSHRFEIAQKGINSQRNLNESKELFHNNLLKKYSQDDVSQKKNVIMNNNNQSGLFSPRTNIKNSTSCTFIPKQLRGFNSPNKINQPFLNPSQKISAQKKILSEEYKFKIQMSVFPVDIEDFQFMKDLGHGSYATVHSAIHKKSNFQVAIKSYDKKKLQDPQKKQNVEREVKILQNVNHKNIIKLYKMVESLSSINLIMEYSSSLPLNMYLKQKPSRRLHELEAKVIFRQIVEAVQYLHKKKVIHRDIKLENILIDSERRIKLIDFGFSIAVQPSCKLSMFCGTPSYMAPEIINKQGYSFGVDIWALGILLHKLLTSQFPFQGKDDKQLFRNILKCQTDYPMYISPSARKLLQAILKEDSSDRKSLDDILNDEWF